MYVCMDGWMSGGNCKNKTIKDKVNVYTHSLSPDLPFYVENYEDLIYILENS